MNILKLFQNILYSSWSRGNSKRSCFIIFASAILFLLSLLTIGFIYVHIFVENYNLRRLSRYPLVCSTVENEWVGPEKCELPWDRNHVTIGRSDLGPRLFEEDFHSEIVSDPDQGQETVLQRSAGVIGGKNGSKIGPDAKRMERHFSWSSCGEFCSTSQVDQHGCRRLQVNVRKPGSKLTFVECSNVDVIECPFLDNENGNGNEIKKKEENEGKEEACFTSQDKNCLKLGIFNCVKELGPSKKNREALVLTTTTPGRDEKNSSSLRTFGTNSTGSLSSLYSSIDTTLSTNLTTTANDSSTTSTPVTPETTPSSLPLKEGLSCTHIEKLISCNMTKLQEYDDYSLTRFNCSNPSSDKCFSTPGTFVCDSESFCRMIPSPEKTCSRICERIPLDEKNVVIADELYKMIVTANCTKGYRGKRKRIEVWPKGIKHKTDPNMRLTPPILVNCNLMESAKLLEIAKTKNSSGVPMDLNFGDCFSGTRLENVSLPIVSTLRELQALWSLNLMTDDFNLDPINGKDAPTAKNLTLHESAPLFVKDFYKNMGEGCKPEDNKKSPAQECDNFYQQYGRLSEDLKGQSVFLCYCRSVNLTSPRFCVVGDMKGLEVFDRHWEDYVVDVLENHFVIFIVLFGVILAFSLTVICILLYPLITDLEPITGNNVMVGIGTNSIISTAKRSPSVKSVKFLDEQGEREPIFSVSGRHPSHSPRREPIQLMDIPRLMRSRSGSIASVNM